MQSPAAATYCTVTVRRSVDVEMYSQGTLIAAVSTGHESRLAGGIEVPSPNAWDNVSVTAGLVGRVVRMSGLTGSDVEAALTAMPFS